MSPLNQVGRCGETGSALNSAGCSFIHPAPGRSARACSAPSLVPALAGLPLPWEGRSKQTVPRISYSCVRDRPHALCSLGSVTLSGWGGNGGPHGALAGGLMGGRLVCRGTKGPSAPLAGWLLVRARSTRLCA